MSIAVVTDSTADMPSSLAEEQNIHTVPSLVIFGENEYRDGVDIKADEFYARLEADKQLFPTTSQPTVGQFQQAFENILDEHEQIVSVHITSKLSGTYASALEGGRQADPSGNRIISIDSNTVSMSTSWLALEVREKLNQGATAEEAAEAARSMVQKTAFLGTPETLEYLKRGGRLSGPQAAIGTVLRIRPVLSIQDGVIIPTAKSRSHRKAMAKIQEAAEAHAPLTNLCVMYSTDSKEAEETLSELQGLVSPGGRAMTAQLGPAIGAHLGPRSICLSFSW